MIENIELKGIPHFSGVYWIKDVDGVVIYIGSSKDLYYRMIHHRSYIKKGSKDGCKTDFYQFLQSNKFTVEFQLTGDYRLLEQQLIEQYNPKYNQVRANAGCGTEKGRKTEYSKEYYHKHYKEEQKQYYESHREERKQYSKQYDNQLCNYNNEILTLCALRARFIKLGISHPTLEAKKYLI